LVWVKSFVSSIRKDEMSRDFENDVLRRIFGTREQEVT
jgi:hypothetical protein